MRMPSPRPPRVAVTAPRWRRPWWSWRCCSPVGGRAHRRRRDGLAAPRAAPAATRTSSPPATSPATVSTSARPRPALDEPLAEPLAVPGRRHLHLRQLPRLPRPAQPDARSGSAPSSPRAGGCCRSPSARRRRCQPRFPRYDDDPKINPKRGTDGLLPAGPQPGHRRGRPRPSASPRRWASSPGSTIWYDLEGFNDDLSDCRESALAFLSAWTDRLPRARLRLGRLLQRRVRHQDARRRPRRAARPVQPPRPDLDRPLGRQGQHLDRPTSATTAGCRAAG